MMPWKKSVGKSRVNCSRMMVLDRRRRVDRKHEVSGWKTKESSVWNIQQDEIREIGRGVVVQ